MAEEVIFGSKIFEEAVQMLQKIPAADRGVSFENNSRRTALTVHGDTALALMFILDNVDQWAAGIRHVQQFRESWERAKAEAPKSLPLQIPNPTADTDFYERVRKIIETYSAKVALWHVDDMASSARRVNELLEANNRYLQEARDARAELKAYKEANGHGN